MRWHTLLVSSVAMVTILGCAGPTGPAGAP
jgi:hypothetical protein